VDYLTPGHRRSLRGGRQPRRFRSGRWRGIPAPYLWTTVLVMCCVKKLCYCSSFFAHLLPAGARMLCVFVATRHGISPAFYVPCTLFFVASCCRRGTRIGMRRSLLRADLRTRRAAPRVRSAPATALPAAAFPAYLHAFLPYPCLPAAALRPRLFLPVSLPVRVCVCGDTALRALYPLCLSLSAKCPLLNTFPYLPLGTWKGFQLR
jgi:hypothetical protein